MKRLVKTQKRIIIIMCIVVVGLVVVILQDRNRITKLEILNSQYHGYESSVDLQLTEGYLLLLEHVALQQQILNRLIDSTQIKQKH